ncbi:MAG: hypothetical protein WBI83_03300 [bacterium]|nr:hypothetical protein [Bacillota bacterium]HHW55962.1 hypothetical protein [Bacillota bacterium]
MAQPDVRNEVITARKLLLMVQDGIALSRGRNADDYGVVIRDCARKRYYYRVDKALKDLEKLLMLIPTEVQRVADKSESTVIRNFLTDLSIALSKEKPPAEFFREQRQKLEKVITELRLQALEEAVFGGETADY